MSEFNVTPLFVTPLLVAAFENAETVNKELKMLALTLEKEAEVSVQKSNLGGWHSDTRFLGRDEKCIHDLCQFLSKAIEQYVTKAALRQISQSLSVQLEGWVNINRKGAYNRPHNHAGVHLSGVYYIDTGTDVPDNPSSGNLELIDPRIGVGMTNSPLESANSATIKPKNGNVVIFPSWLSHWVHPYEGEEPRISMAFNARLSERKK